MTSQMGSSVAPGRPVSAPAVRLAGRAVTSAILTYFGLIVTKGGAFAKGSCGAWLTRPAKGPALGGLDHIGSSVPTQTRRASQAWGSDRAAKEHDAAGAARSGRRGTGQSRLGARRRTVEKRP